MVKKMHFYSLVSLHHCLILSEEDHEKNMAEATVIAPAGNDLWELLHLFLPRFLRITVKNNDATISTVVQQLQQDNPGVILLQVPWLPSFVALPGYVAISSLILSSVNGVSVFPMDIASGIPPDILVGQGTKSPQKVLDLCCCPGGKFLMLSDFLAPTATIVGVDISKQRMYTTKSLVHKYLNDVYANNTEHVPPRMLLFCSDGTKFSNSISNDLLYDSRIGLDEILSSGYKRKKNKSMRGREERRLKSVRRELATAIAVAPPIISTATTIAVSSDDCGSGRGGGERGREFSAKRNENCLIDRGTRCISDSYDAVLVDAQCTHDSSYRHLRYVGDNCTDDKAGQDNIWGNVCRNHKNIDTVESDGNVYALQRQLLAKGFASLVEGGELVYSTCSAELEQNEQVVEWLLNNEEGKAELVSVADTWCQNRMSSCSNTYLVGKEDTDLFHLVQLLEQEPINYAALLDFLRRKHTITTDHNPQGSRGLDASSSSYRLLADEMCRYASSFLTPPGREGRLSGTAYFGMWGGTSGLFLSRIRKRKQHDSIQ